MIKYVQWEIIENIKARRFRRCLFCVKGHVGQETLLRESWGGRQAFKGVMFAKGLHRLLRKKER